MIYDNAYIAYYTIWYVAMHILYMIYKGYTDTHTHLTVTYMKSEFLTGKFLNLQKFRKLWIVWNQFPNYSLSYLIHRVHRGYK